MRKGKPGLEDEMVYLEVVRKDTLEKSEVDEIRFRNKLKQIIIKKRQELHSLYASIRKSDIETAKCKSFISGVEKALECLDEQI